MPCGKNSHVPTGIRTRVHLREPPWFRSLENKRVGEPTSTPRHRRNHLSSMRLWIERSREQGLPHEAYQVRFLERDPNQKTSTKMSWHLAKPSSSKLGREKTHPKSTSVAYGPMQGHNGWNCCLSETHRGTHIVSSNAGAAVLVHMQGLPSQEERQTPPTHARQR